jgi:hypothetical protein
VANIKSFPNNQDEFIGAEYVMRWLHGRTSGVFGADGKASVAPVLDTMAVTVSDGNGWISNDNADGVVWWIDNEAVNGSKLQIPVEIADAILPRIDRVVVSWQTTNYVALPTVEILKGTPASNPVAPELTNNSTLRQISLAAINIPAGTTAITSAMITDERLDPSVCGIVTDKVGVDTSVMLAQWREAYNEFSQYMAAQKAAWDAFFAAVTLDTVFPVPSVGDEGKAPAVNADATGYILKNDHDTITATLGTEWEGDSAPYTQTIPIVGILATDTPHVTPVYSGDVNSMIEQKEAWAVIDDAETLDGAILFTCFEETPTVAVTIQIEVNR